MKRLRNQEITVKTQVYLRTFILSLVPEVPVMHDIKDFIPDRTGHFKKCIFLLCAKLSYWLILCDY